MEPLKTFLLINKNEFCAGKDFKGSIIDILCNHLFKQGAKAKLENTYDEMARGINVEGDKKIIQLYPLDGTLIRDELKNPSIQRGDKVYAGHDLPVWRNDPDLAEIKIMVITQDPRRSDNEMTKNGMNPNDDCISISTPFGLHSQTYRSHKNRGLVHYLFNNLQEKLKKYNYNPKKLSFYYTDIYKFRGIAPAKDSNLPKDVKDKLNICIYIKVLKCEIETYKPDIILLMGNDAQNAWNEICNVLKDEISNGFNANTQTLPTPHPSPNANGKWKEKSEKWKEELKEHDLEISSFTADVKIDLIIELILKKLKDLNKIPL